MNKSGVFFAEEKPPQGDNRIVCAAENIFYKIMCAPKSATQEEIERAAGPSGTSRGWKIDTERDDHCVTCQDDPSRKHWLLSC